MSHTAHVYMPPRIIPANEIPAGVLSFLNGEDLLSKTQALRLSTVDAEGWPQGGRHPGPPERTLTLCHLSELRHRR